MGVDLRCRYVAVTEHCLDRAQVGAVHEQISGEAVAHGVGTDVLGDTG